MKILDRSLQMHREAGDEADGSYIDERLEWRYEVMWGGDRLTEFDESALCVRSEILPYMVWYYGPYFSKCDVYAEVAKRIPDVRREEIDAILGELKRMKEAADGYCDLKKKLGCSMYQDI